MNIFTLLKKLIFLCFVFSFLTSVAQTVPEYMYFKCDAPGNQTNYASAPVGTNPAILNGITIGGTGQFGTAMVGNGLVSTSNRLNTGWATSLPSTGWTISFYVNNLPATSSTTYYYFGDPTAASFRCFTGGVAGNGNLLLRGTGITDVPINGISMAPYVIHLVYTGTEIKVFKNGVFSNTVVQTAIGFTGTGPFTVGGYSSSNSMNAGTVLDEFRLYNRALSDAEVGATWNIELSNGPTVTTTAATNVTCNSATLNGTINPNGNSTTVSFEYGLTIAYGTTVSGTPSPITGNTVTNVSAALTGLAPNSVYHYRVRGTAGSNTVNGNDLTFTTGPAQTMTTAAATNIYSTKAMLNATGNANGSTTTTSFEYGLTTAYGSNINATPNSITGSSNTNLTAPLTGLAPHTLYHFRAVGVSGCGTINGTDMTFTTGDTIPFSTTDPPTNINVTSAQLNGTVIANNLSSTVTFDYGLTTAYGSTVTATPGTVNGMTPATVSANITGLTTGATYHYRCCATSSAGTSCGNDQTLVPGCPAPAAAGPISGPVNVCPFSQATYSVSPILNATAYVWAVPTGTTITSGANTNTITVLFGNTSGNVTVYGAGSCGNGTPSNLFVNMYGVTTPVITGSATACQGASCVYSTAAGMTSYNWTVSAGGSISSGGNTNSVTVVWSTTGAKTVGVNYTNSNGCIATTPGSLAVTVNSAPAPTITGQTMICVNSGYYDYVTQPGFTNYIWTISPGGIINYGSGTNQVQVSWIQAGAQWITVNYNNASGCAAATATNLGVTVNPPPLTVGTVTGTAAECGGANGVAYSTSTIPGAIAYVWTLPVGATVSGGAGTNNILVDFAPDASSGNITVYGNNLCGNGPVSTPYLVSVTPLAAQAGTITGDNSLCDGAMGVAYSVPPIANATGYNWTVPSGGTIVGGLNTASITVDFAPGAQSGDISVNGTNTCGGGGASTMNVAINAIPATPVITANGCELSSSAASGNQWYYSSTQGGTGVPVNGATFQTCTATQTGYYWTVVTENECSSSPSNVEYIIIEGISGHLTGNFNLFPIPNDGKFTVVISDARSAVDVKVVNSVGINIWQNKIKMINGNHDIDLRPLTPGVYSVIFSDGLRQIVRKIVVK